MALTASLILAGIAIGLLVLYAADVAVAMSSDSDHGFLPLDHMQRGMGLGGPAIDIANNCIFHFKKRTLKRIGCIDNNFRHIDHHWWNRSNGKPCPCC